MLNVELNVGDVVRYKDKLYVIMVIKDYTSKNFGHSGYDYGIDYILCEYDVLERFDGKVITKLDIDGRIITVHSSNINDENMIKIDDIPPYEILQIEAYSIRKKTPKTIVVYV